MSDHFDGIPCNPFTSTPYIVDSICLIARHGITSTLWWHLVGIPLQHQLRLLIWYVYGFPISDGTTPSYHQIVPNFLSQISPKKSVIVFNTNADEDIKRKWADRCKLEIKVLPGGYASETIWQCLFTCHPNTGLKTVGTDSNLALIFLYKYFISADKDDNEFLREVVNAYPFCGHIAWKTNI